MIVDGRAIAEALYRKLGERRHGIVRPVRLGIVMTRNDSVIEQFVRIKERAAKRLDIGLVRAELDESATTGSVIAAIQELVKKTDGIIVQLPLPSAVDVNAVLSEIPRDKDVDAINPRHSGERAPIHAPVAEAVLEILATSAIDPAGTRAVVVGAGRLVGAPAAALLRERGAQVSLVTREEGSLADLKNADIIVSGAGEPGLITPDRIKDGVVLIDAGTSEQGGAVRGDADPACAEKAAVFTPVPGGIGPIAVAMIFKNLFDLIS